MCVVRQALGLERWHHVALVFHRKSRLEVYFNGAQQVVIATPTDGTLLPISRELRQNFMIGGSAQYHISAPAIVAQARMHHHQALDVAEIREIARSPPKFTPPPEPKRTSSPGGGMLAKILLNGQTIGQGYRIEEAIAKAMAAAGEAPAAVEAPGALAVASPAEGAVPVEGAAPEAAATEGAAGGATDTGVAVAPGAAEGAAEVAPTAPAEAVGEAEVVAAAVAGKGGDPSRGLPIRGVTLPPRHEAGYLHHLEEFLGGKDHALLGMAHRARLGIGEFAEPRCEVAAAYYRAAADIALKAVENSEASAVEFVRLSDEVEKVEAFTGQRGEDDALVKYQQNLAEAGDAPAQAWLGHRYYWGAGGLPRDRARALQLLGRAAEAGNVEAQYNLGVMHAYGHGVERNREEGVRLFRAAADQGYVAAHNGLALALTDGASDNNFTEAFIHFNRSAQSGNADGLYNAALLLRDGRGVEKDEVVALAWMHLEGKGAPQSCSAALSYLKPAAERGPWGALLRDGLDAYLNDDIGGALASYEAAAELGYEVAQSNAAWLYTERCPGAGCMLPHAETRKRALHFFQMAADNGNAEARRKVGDALWYGDGVSANRSAAVHAYRIAAAAGDMQSRFNHVALLLQGEDLDAPGTARGAGGDVHARARTLAAQLYADASRSGSGALYPALVLHSALEARAWALASYGRGARGIAWDAYSDARRWAGGWLERSGASGLGESLQGLREQLGEGWTRRKGRRERKVSDRQMLHLMLAAAVLALLVRLLLSLVG
ncbi:hypothetical protein T484DRAFT_1940011 [Baffinella frigidus]|nr:hypothetical protein T484DRAFT_1940011 [Cryptophyta sp. CCMP2293]